jgi:hypothetical protein
VATALNFGNANAARSLITMALPSLPSIVTLLLPAGAPPMRIAYV